MKSIKIILLFLFIFSLQSCGEEYIETIIPEYNQEKRSSDSNTGQNENPSDDTPNKTLKILAIGNSFTDDGTAYLPSLVKKAGIDNVTIAKMVVGGTSLQYHYTHAINDDPVYNFSVSTDGNFKSQGKKKFSDCFLFESWDYIILQQVSQHSGMYETYQPYLNNLISIIHSYNPKAVIGWQMTWAYSSTSSHSGFKNYERSQTMMYESILNAVNQMKAETGISVVIPTGMVIQELRGTNINNNLELTRDGYHLDYGAGRYAAACTWYETLIYPKFHINVISNPFRVNKGNIPVTDDIALICQETANTVVQHYYFFSNNLN